MKNGINQSGRMLAPLDPTFVGLDERSLLELVQFTLNYAEAVSYFNFQNKPVGTWKPFLLNNPVFITGLIASTSLESYKLRQDDLVSKADERLDTDKKPKEEMAENLLAMIKNLIYWEDLFRSCNYTGSILKEIMNGIKFVEPVIKMGITLQKRFKASDFPGLDLQKVDSSQEVSLKESFKLSYKNLLYIVDFAERRFDEMMEDHTRDHQPHIGLLLASLKLFREIQTDLNQLTKRHLDFYYQRILQQSPLPTAPIQLLVGLYPKPGGWLLPANSAFTLQFPSKKTIPFENRLITELSQCRIAEIRTFYKNDYYPFSAGHKLQEVSLNSLFEAVLYRGAGRQEISFPGEELQDFPLTLGEDQSQKGLAQRSMVSSPMGFVVSSPVFSVEHGSHFFKIVCALSRESADKFKGLLSDLLHDKEAYMGIAHQHDEQELKSFMVGFLNEAFSVSLTTKAGWKTLDYLQVQFSHADSTLVFKIEPEGEAELPSVFEPGLHDGLSGTEWPCVRFSLNNSAHYPPYKLMSLLEVTAIEIHTLSRGVSSGLECYNQIGKLDPTNPFLPFGAIPSKDSYLKVYNPLILNRFLSRLSISLKWMGLPENRNGFKEYYQAYPERITDKSFVATVSIKSDLYRENPSDEAAQQQVPMFETTQKADGNYLLKSKSINVNLDLVEMTALKEPRSSAEFLKKDQSYFSLRIAEPVPFAFGHEQYTQLYADTSLYNSRFPKKQKELPKPAYTPQLEKIEISYCNFTKENLGRKTDDEASSIKFFHLFPFGHKQVFPASRSSESNLLPQVKGKGNLLIGLVDVEENQVINLGFKLHPAFFIHTITQPPRVIWEYLERNQWQPLGNLMMEDSTHGMLQSGIVKIRLPNKLDFSNTRLASGKFWLRASYVGKADINSRLLSMFTNAMWLTEVKNEEVGSFTIDEMRQSLSVVSNGNPVVDSVSRPFHLIIPAIKKSFEMDRIRVSELIRHRNRGISTWDMERLVLERFPQIGRVMVYGRSDYPLHMVKNSNIQAVVIPQSPLLSNGRSEGFRTPYELLREIRAFLKTFVSPFARVEVCNPVFEKLKIRASVKFKQAQQAGFYRDRLERELIEFLSPNPGDFQKEKGFINSIYKTEIQTFIESRSYVDSMTAFSVLQIVEVQGSYKIIDTADTAFNVERLRTISPYAILTSSETHQLEILNYQELKDPEIASIGDLSIDSDFIIKSFNI
ncbi:hypothetical protein [Algoriphagus sp.]|uniref:hypothetical protein n=1 Tax=Algoriphagus sp. TaxID=1872435 RepID=UPI003F716F02